MMNSKRKFAVFAAGVALLALSAVTQASMETDRRIEAAFRNSLVYTSYLTDPKDKVTITSEDGVVTLKGKVTDKVDKSLAESTAESIEGVKRVDNKLEVSNTDDANPDSWTATKVKTALMFHRNVSGLKTDVTVKNGIVTLNGVADSQAQKELTSQYAQDIDGVKSVRNQMTVSDRKPDNEKSGQTAAATIDDASVTSQVKMALLFHRATSALRTQVNTKDGVVTVSGHAKNAAEKDLVTEIVSDINGVKNVVNNMVIADDLKG